MANEFLQAHRFRVEIAGFRSSEFSYVSPLSLNGVLVLTRGMRAGDLDCFAWAKNKGVRTLSVVLLGADGEPCVTYLLLGTPIRYETGPLVSDRSVVVLTETLTLSVSVEDAR